MTVGLVVVSHSAALASGVAELAGQMAPEVTIVAAGGTDDGALGTSFELVSGALAEADSGDGVVVVYDLGSALLTTETALELLDPDQAERVVVADGPLVEGAVAAAIAAQSGSERALVAQAVHRAAESWAVADAGAEPAAAAPAGDGSATATATVADAIGIHARPAALLARELDAWPATTVRIGRPGQQPVDAGSVLMLIGLGLRQGEQVEIAADGPDAADATRRLADLIDAGLDPS